MTVSINSTVKKPSKNTAFYMLMEARKGKELDQFDIESLLLYFAPPTTKKPKNAIQWVAKAVGVKDAREALNFILIKENVATASDGHRIHQAELNSDNPMEDGWYCPKTMLKVSSLEMHVSYQDAFNRLIKPKPVGEIKTVEIAELETVAIENKKPLFVYKMPEVSTRQIGINRSYFEDASPVAAYYNDNKLVGSSEFGNFTIMGARL